MNKHINIVFCCDENYLQYLVPCIISILDSKNEDTFIDIFVLETGISDYHKGKIKELTTHYVKFEFINVEQQAKDLILNKKHHKNHYNNSILYKLLVPQIFKDKERVLLLDADTIVQKDLLDLYNQDFEDNYLVATVDNLPYLESFYYNNKQYSAEEFYKNILKLPSFMCERDAKYYINAGVMLFNITKILKDKREQELVDIFLQYQESLVFAEQDVFVKVFLDKIKALAEYHHITSTLYNHSHKLTIANDVRALSNAIVVHYIGSKSLVILFKSIYASAYFNALQSSYLAIPKWKLYLIKLNTLKKSLYRKRLWYTIPYILKTTFKKR